MFVKKIIKKFIYSHKADSETYIRHLRKIGISIGERVNIYEPLYTCIDETRPYLIDIGNDVKITRGVTILTHGYDWSVLAGKFDVVLGSAGTVKIGNNVFIGMNSIILKGVNIGDNVIIGAGSVINKDIPNNSVAVGNPAKVVMSVDDYYEKRKNAQLNEAYEIYDAYVSCYSKEPPLEIFDEFFFLFWDISNDIPEKFKRQMSHNGRFKESYNNLVSHEKKFHNYEEFIESAKNRSLYK